LEQVAEGINAPFRVMCVHGTSKNSKEGKMEFKIKLKTEFESTYVAQDIQMEIPMKTLFTTTLLTLALVACGNKGDSGGGGSFDYSSGDSASGASVYSTTCSGCHGAAGEGSPGYAPAMCEDVPGLDADGLATVILDGKGDMPAQGLTDQQTADVIAFLQETFTSSTCP